MTFIARYEGTCAADCGQRIRPDDECKWIDGQAAHAACKPSIDSLTLVREVCDRCFMEKSAAGTCGCDD